MRCANCQNQINDIPLVCPYCHTNPMVFGSLPYDGVKSIGESGDGAEMLLGVLGLLTLPVLPPVGLALWGIAGLSLAAKWWQSKKEK